MLILVKLKTKYLIFPLIVSETVLLDEAWSGDCVGEIWGWVIWRRAVCCRQLFIRGRLFEVPCDIHLPGFHLTQFQMRQTG